MNRKYSLVAFALLCAFVMNYQTISSKIAQAPSGNDGDPTTFPMGGQTCAQCHSGNSLQSAAGKVDISFDEGGNTYTADSFKYKPGTEYTVHFAPTVIASRYGFQLSTLQTDSANAGTLAVTNASNTVISTGVNTKYIGHKDANTTNTWAFKWIAPASNVGNVTMYYTFVAANASNTEFGDTVYKGSTTFTADPTAGIANVTIPISNLTVFPNPAVNTFNISYTTDVATSGEAVLYNLYAQAVKRNVLPSTTGRVNQVVDVTGLPQGIYLLQVKAGEKQSTVKVAVQ